MSVLFVFLVVLHGVVCAASVEVYQPQEQQAVSGLGDGARACERYGFSPLQRGGDHAASRGYHRPSR